MVVSYFALLTVLATGCLAVNTKILNGRPATPHQFPYHVGLYQKYLEQPMSRLEYYCGGTVVSDTWVLTAANCRPYRDQLFIKAGKHVVGQEESSEQIRLAVRHIVHPEYERAIASVRPIAQNDIAMIKVDKPFDFNKNVRAAEVPSVDAFFTAGFLAGWGATSLESYVPNFPEELHYDDFLQTINAQDCADAINKVAFKSALSPVEISNNQTCTSKENRGACYKDYGSALVGQDGGTYVIIGIVSDTILPCGVVGLPTVYSRVSAYSEWIEKAMKSF